jgi:hypothetical protein
MCIMKVDITHCFRPAQYHGRLIVQAISAHCFLAVSRSGPVHDGCPVAHSGDL